MKKIIPVICFVLILAGCSFASNNNSENRVNTQAQKNQTKTEKEPPKVEQEPKIQTTKVSMAAIGDLLIHSSVYEDAKTASGYDFRPMIELVKPYMKAADLTIANQETMIGGSELGLSTYPRFNSPYAVGDAFSEAGVDVVSMANNHSLDRGIPAIRNAINHWDELGVKHTGAYLSEEASRKITTITKKGITFSFLSYTYGTNGIPLPDGKEYTVNLIDNGKMKRDIKKAKKVSDVVVVSLHYGAQYIRMPNEDQQELVKFVVNKGADIVWGHHPHVLQPFKWIEAKDGHRAFVAYSLGNFLSGQDELYRKIGGIAKIDIVKIQEGNDTSITLENPGFMPTYVHYENWRNFKVYPLQTVPSSKLPNADKLYEQMNLHVSQWMDDLSIIKVNQ